ncbi:Ubiquitin carboxylterminal hydrolase 34like [Caligus rogercresseyi]|uniref:Ubiquitin carboxylterminal hydrolase 34like n=1 Tax=Caligus rogercresseyi TaxID=217165 RepID=A0A7T8KGJ5_CALRO|nr:Ubiquitin carboxylterminal hydrolase 34like [Caligus rogercresseyi]
MEKELYMEPWCPKGSDDRYPSEEVRPLIGSSSPISRFIRMLLKLLESGSARPHLKHLSELFRFLYDFSKLGRGVPLPPERQHHQHLRRVLPQAVKQQQQPSSGGGGDNTSITIDVISEDDEEDDDIIALSPLSESSKMASLDKMVCLIALLVEKSRGEEDNLIHLSEADANALTEEEDNINTCQTCNLIFSLTRNNPELAEQVAAMVFAGVKQADVSMHFFRLLTLLTEFSGGPSGMPCFTNLVMHKVWELARTCPQAALDWLSIQVTRNRYVQSWLLSTMDNWVEQYLIAHPNQKVRNSASFLVVSLVPSNHFRQAFRTARSSTVLLDSEERDVLHQVLEFLYGLLPNCRHYAELQTHGSAKLVAYFQTMSHFLLSRTEKLMFEPHFLNLWQLFHPKLSEPSIPIHHNKQALLNFWYNLCLDCSENVRMILANSNVTKNIAFNYILADHEDTEVINFNRIMLPTYYGLLRLCCLQSRSFTRQLAQHQNIHWAFKNITPYTTQYTVACDELFKLMRQRRSRGGRRGGDPRLPSPDPPTLSLHPGRAVLLEHAHKRTQDPHHLQRGQDIRRLQQRPRPTLDALNMLHMMLHEATACHVTGELIDLLSLFLELVKAVRLQRNNGEIRQILSRWKDMSEMTGRLLTLCNSFNPPDLRNVCLSGIKEMLLLWPLEMLNILVPMLHRAHSNSSDMDSGSPALPSLKTIRPPRPMFQMAVPASQLLAHHGQDPDYDRALQQYFAQYHATVDLMVRLVDLSAMGDWTEYHYTCNSFLNLITESLMIENPLSIIHYVSSQVLTDQVTSIISQLVSNFIDMAGSFVLDRLSPVRHLNGDLRALFLVSSSRPHFLSPELLRALKDLSQSVEKSLEGRGRRASSSADEGEEAATAPPGGKKTNTTSSTLLEESSFPEMDPEAAASTSRASISTDIDEFSKKLEDEQQLLRKSPDARLIDSLSTLQRTLILLVQICEKEDKETEKGGGGGSPSKEEEQEDSSRKQDQNNPEATL